MKPEHLEALDIATQKLHKMLHKTKSPIQAYFSKTLVARGRFELPSAGPEPAMLDRYTTGLFSMPILRLFSLINFLFSV